MKKTLLVFFLFGMLFSCKKSPELEKEKPTRPVEESTKEQLIRDSIYYYYNLYSYWTDAIPDYTNFRQFSGAYNSNDEVLSALKVMTPAFSGDGYGGHYDRFSYIDANYSSGKQSRLKMDNNDGYGMYITIGVAHPTYASLFIYMVEGGSPAQKAGIKRGAEITEINGNAAVTIPGTVTNGKFTVSDKTQYNNVVNIITEALKQNTFSLKYNDVQGNNQSASLTNSTYEIHPNVKDTVLNTNVGYLAFTSFESTSGNNWLKQEYETIFSKFEQANISNLIIDMRYNTGGYVSTAEYLADKIVPNSGNGKLMYKYDTNKYLEPLKTGKNAEFGDVYFNKTNPLSLNKVYFLVSETTASAAELLINVLKPYMSVYLIGETDRTFGKPVGFFEQPIANTIALWPVSFKTINANGNTDYWNGLGVDAPNVTDYIFKDFGDPTEDMIAAALTHIQTGTFTSKNLKAGNKAVSSRKLKLQNINQVKDHFMLKERKR